MRSREQVEIAMPGSPSWMPCAPQGVKGLDDDDDDDDVLQFNANTHPLHNFFHRPRMLLKINR